MNLVDFFISWPRMHQQRAWLQHFPSPKLVLITSFTECLLYANWVRSCKIVICKQACSIIPQAPSLYPTHPSYSCLLTYHRIICLPLATKFQFKGPQVNKAGTGYSLTRKPIRKHFMPWCPCIFYTYFYIHGHLLHHTIRTHKRSNLLISRMVPWPFKLRFYLMKNNIMPNIMPYIFQVEEFLHWLLLYEFFLSQYRWMPSSYIYNLNRKGIDNLPMLKI